MRIEEEQMAAQYYDKNLTESIKWTKQSRNSWNTLQYSDDMA